PAAGRTLPTTVRRGPRAVRQSRHWPQRPALRSRCCPARSGLAYDPRGFFVAVLQLSQFQRGVLSLLAGSEDHAVMRRLAAHRVGIAGIAGEHEGLAATAAEILVLLVARTTGLGHPVITTEAVEAERLAPDMREAVLAHVGKLHRQLPRTVAGQRRAVRGDVEEQVAPAVHARLGALLVVVRGDEDQFARVV